MDCIRSAKKTQHLSAHIPICGLHPPAFFTTNPKHSSAITVVHLNCSTQINLVSQNLLLYNMKLCEVFLNL